MIFFQGLSSMLRRHRRPLTLGAASSWVRPESAIRATFGKMVQVPIGGARNVRNGSKADVSSAPEFSVLQAAVHASTGLFGFVQDAAHSFVE